MARHYSRTELVLDGPRNKTPVRELIAGLPTQQREERMGNIKRGTMWMTSAMRVEYAQASGAAATTSVGPPSSAASSASACLELTATLTAMGLPWYSLP